MPFSFKSIMAPANWQIMFVRVMRFVLGITLLSAFAAFAGTTGQLTVLKSFGSNAASEALISAPLIEASDGYLYGTAQTGGSNGEGVIFRITKSGTDYKILHAFSGADGSAPQARVLEGALGELYGTTSAGGSSGAGVLFTLNRDGSGYGVLHHFATSDGQAPVSHLIRANDGMLYGTTSAGASNGSGTIFKANTNGTGFQTVFQFGSSATGAHNPVAGLIQDSAGLLYGTGLAGGLDNVGAVFKIATNGTGYAILHHFTATDGDGQSPKGALLEANDGMLYGSASGGGLDGFGCVFKLAKNGSGYSLIHNFAISDAQGPRAALIQASDGFLYGTTANGGSKLAGAIYKLGTDGLFYDVLRSFGTLGDGRNPTAELIQGSDGELYGTASTGGAVSGGVADGGTVFKIDTTGSVYTTLHSFSRTGGDGHSPATLITASDGFLYGTTYAGGAFGGGTIYRIRPNGTSYQLLQSFRATNPVATAEQVLPSKLLLASDGILYGTTEFGGAFGLGTIFKINRNGSSFSVLRNFTRITTDGRNPSDGLIEGSDGMLYGATQFGGSSDAGAVFKLNKNGSGFILLHSFSSAASGVHYPYSGLLRASNQKLYGTIFSGGTGGGGAIFQMNEDGSDYALLHSFGAGDGINPVGQLMEASDGLLYGTTQQGGTAGVGVAFSIGKDGTDYKLLWNFPATNGPSSDLVQAQDGRLYGTINNGGIAGAGTIFRLNTNGSGFEVLYRFGLSNASGRNPQAALLLDSAGILYGTTGNGGDLGLGTVFSFVIPVRLAIREISPSSVELHWPATPIQYHLESRVDFNTPPGWQTFNASPTLSDGEYRLSLSVDATKKFFRLAQ